MGKNYRYTSEVYSEAKCNASIFESAVPFKLIPLLEKELAELEQAGIFTKIENSEWATPIVPVLKAYGSIRVCGDYKSPINSKLIVDEHPLPITNELFAKLADSIKFSKIDLRVKHTYN